MKYSMQCLKRISFLAYGCEAEDSSFDVADSAKVEFVNGLVLPSLRLEVSVQVATAHVPTEHGSGRISH